MSRKNILVINCKRKITFLFIHGRNIISPTASTLRQHFRGFTVYLGTDLLLLCIIGFVSRSRYYGMLGGLEENINTTSKVHQTLTLLVRLSTLALDPSHLPRTYHNLCAVWMHPAPCMSGLIC